MLVVIEIGCLECGYKSELLGVYQTVTDAKVDHPSLHVADEDTHWRGDGMKVGFFLPHLPDAP